MTPEQSIVWSYFHSLLVEGTYLLEPEDKETYYLNPAKVHFPEFEIHINHDHPSVAYVYLGLWFSDFETGRSPSIGIPFPIETFPACVRDLLDLQRLSCLLEDSADESTLLQQFYLTSEQQAKARALLHSKTRKP